MKNLEENYISAVVVVHDNAPVLADKLKSLNGALAGLFKYFEIIVVDNFSRDNTAEVLKSIQLPMAVVTLARWHNSQSALTAGVELAIGDYILEIPSIGAGVDYGLIEELYRVCQQGSDFVFLVPEKTRTASRLFYRLLNGYYRGRTSEQFVSSMMTLSSRRGQNKTADVGTRIVNRNVTYLLTGLKCATVKSTAINNDRRSLRENFDLMTDTLIFHTDYIAALAFRAALVFLGVSLCATAYSLAMFFTINTAPGWASTFILIAIGFGALFALTAVICKYLSSLIKLHLPKNYTFSSVEKKEPR
jgi:glycosyltransferase involved in cell wall biosynthesis